MSGWGEGWELQPSEEGISSDRDVGVSWSTGDCRWAVLFNRTSFFKKVDLMALYGGIELTGRPDLENVRKLDLLPLPAIREMMQYGMAIDRDALHSLSGTLAAEMKELRYEICSYIPPEKLDEFIEKSGIDDDSEDEWVPMNVDSSHQIRNLLFNVLGVGKGHQLKLTKGGDISTGKRQLETRKKDNPVIQTILDYRERAKLKNTYSDKLPQMAKRHPVGSCWCGLKHWAETWRIHCDIMTTRTSTGRPATKNPNLQNIPVRTKHGRAVRAAFVATPGTELVTVDFSQLELRILAHVAEVSRLIECFKRKKDPHTATAMWAFGYAPVGDLSYTDADEKQVDKLTQRTPCKNVNFGVAYRETWMGLFEQLISDTYGKSGIPVPDWLNEEWVKEFLRKWHGVYPEVQPYNDKIDYRARRYGCVWTLFGGIRRIPEVNSVHNRVVAAGLRQGGNMPIQGTGADLLKIAQAEIQDWVVGEVRSAGIWCWPLNEVHDELIFEAELGFGDVVREKAMEVMSNVTVDRQTGENLFRVPLEADGKVGLRWEK